MSEEKIAAVELRVRALEMCNVRTEQVLIGLKEGQDESLAILKKLPCTEHSTKLAVLERNGVYSAGKQTRIDDLFWKVVGYGATGLVGLGIGVLASGILG